MSHLVHTEYLLAGRTRRDVREVLRDSMFAATVTGSPVENACRLIAKYEAARPRLLRVRRRADRPRRRRPAGGRCADPHPHRRRRPRRQRRRSPPAPRWSATPTRPTRRRRPGRRRPASSARSVSSTRRRNRPTDFDAFTREEDVLIALGSRNQRLSQFWLTDQSGTPPVPSLVGKRVVVLDGEDDFVNMLSHVFGVLGMTTDVVRHDAYTRRRARRLRPGGRRARARATRATSTTPRSRVIDGVVRGLLEAAPPVPRRVPRPPGAEPAARARPRVQGHRVPGHAEPAHGARPAGDRRLLQHVRGAGARRRPARRRHAWRPTRPATSTCSPGRTTAACSSTPSRSSPRTATSSCGIW